ncbi:MAG: cystathionine gamma-synthase [Deltaproteobacteria bacterium]|nr:cystathionine gamma-synthase [Deltaproteobacteria bacterium]
MRIETLAVHAGQEPDPSTGAIMTPVYLSSTYAQQGPGGHKGYEYSRTDNPTRTALQKNLAALEGGTHGLAFASGCAAATTVMHLFRPADHIVVADDVYGGTFRLFDAVFRPMGLEFTFADLSAPDALERSLRPATRGVWLETPTNPMLKLIDIEAAAKVCRARSIALMVDNTFATPILQRPLDLGASLVVHSTTKYLNGHSDVVGGAVVTGDDETWTRLKYLQNAIGATPGPMDCFLVLRGIKTLHLRMARHCENAIAIARRLEGHRQVERVIFPGLESHPQHALARRQMRAPGGMISFVLRGGLARARACLETVRVFACAESLGGVESLIEHPAIMTHASVPPETRARLGISDGLIRLSVGVEDIEDLWEDLERGFAAAG